MSKKVSKTVEIPNEEPIINIEKFDDSGKLTGEPVKLEMSKPNTEKISQSVTKHVEPEKVYDRYAHIKNKLNNIDIYRVEFNILTGGEVREAIRGGVLVKINEYKYKVKR